MVIVEDCEGLVDEVSTEFDDELVELDWLLELVEDSLEVDEGLVVFSVDFSVTELEFVDEDKEVDELDLLFWLTPIKIKNKIKITKPPALKYGANFFNLSSFAVKGVISTSASFSKKPKIPAWPFSITCI